MYNCINSTCYILLKMAICICIKKCSFKFWTCSNLIIFLLYLGVYFSAFSNFVQKTLYFSFMISGDRFNLVPPPPLHLSKKKKTIKMCFYSTCLSCFWKQILRPLFPWLISVDVPGRLIYFFFNCIYPFISLLGNKLFGAWKFICWRHSKSIINKHTKN